MIGYVPEMADPLRLFKHYVDSLADCGHICRRHAGTEDQGAGIVLYVIHKGVVSGHETS